MREYCAYFDLNLMLLENKSYFKQYVPTFYYLAVMDW